MSISDSSPVLEMSENGLMLKKGELSLIGDFTRMIPRLKHNNLSHELLVKTAKIKNITDRPVRVLDATAGMGEDSLLLAAAGFEVHLYEYDPVIAALLEDTMKRAAGTDELAGAVGRMQLIKGDSIEAMLEIGRENAAGSDIWTPDVILLDPMFPEREKTAMIKKKFQLLQQLERPIEPDNEIRMLDAAVSAHPRKIVIKRPLKGPFLAGRRPDYSLSGKAIRYDCIVLNLSSG